MNFNRRDFLKVGLLSASAMTFAACGRPVEHGIVSQYQMPEYKVLGEPSFWATTCTEVRSDCSVSVKTVENRAIQVIGIPGHFFSKGAVTPAAVSALNTLYNPNRIGSTKGYSVEDNPAEVVAGLIKKSGSDTLFVVDRLHGSLGDAIVEVAQNAGGKIWVCDSQQSMRERRILKAVTGRAELPLADLENRDYLVTVGSTLLQDSYAPTRTGWAYGRFRKTPGRLRGKMVSFSSRMNATDANADVWVPVAPGAEPYVLGAIGKLLADKGKGSFPSWAAVSPEEAAQRAGLPEGEQAKFAEQLRSLASRLAEANAPLVVGGFQGPNGDATVYLAHTITKMLNGDVTTFEPDRLVGSRKSGKDLFVADSDVSNALQAAKTVIVHNVDLVFRFPWLTDVFEKVSSRVALASMPNETTQRATHVVPVRTWMEDWGDLLLDSPEGTWYGITQPAVRNEVASAQSSLGFMLELAKGGGLKLGNGEVKPRLYLQRELENEVWEDFLVRGGYWEKVEDHTYPHHAMHPPPAIPNAGSPPSGYSVFADIPPLRVSELGDVPEGNVFMVLPTHLADGHLADRPWLQELKDAMTTVVWDSWVEISESMALELGIERHDRVTVSVNGKEIKGSAYPSPFIHPRAIGIPSGRGHSLDLHPEFVSLGWVPEGSNPKKLLDGIAGTGGYFPVTANDVKLAKATGSRLLATFDTRVYNLPRHILPE